MRRRLRRRPPPAAWVVLAILALVLVRIWQEYQGQRETTFEVESLTEGIYAVIRVVDGDTLIVGHNAIHPAEGRPPRERRAARVRLISIDTPESVRPDHPAEPWGVAATRFTQQFVSSGQVKLRFDRRRQDPFGRWLAYVYVGDQMLNLELVRAGLAKVKIYRGDSMTLGRQLELAEDEARAAHRGIWSDHRPSSVGP